VTVGIKSKALDKNREQRTENREQRTENREQRTENRFIWSINYQPTPTKFLKIMYFFLIYFSNFYDSSSSTAVWFIFNATAGLFLSTFFAYQLYPEITCCWINTRKYKLKCVKHLIYVIPPHLIYVAEPQSSK
jgi:hypothetical protein